jgi:hypothetical protein
MIPEIRYDDNYDALRVKFTEAWPEEDIPGVFSRVRKLLEGKKHRYIIGGLSEAAPQTYSKEFRKKVADEAAITWLKGENQ